MRVEFKLDCQTFFGQNVYVVGGHHELGDWDPKHGRRMECKKEAPSKWWVSFDWNEAIPNSLHYKYCIMNDFQEEGGIPIWEPAAERERIVPSDGQAFECADVWGSGTKSQEMFKGVFSGKIFTSPMPFSHMFDPKGIVYGEYKNLPIDCIVCLAYREECTDKTTGRMDLLSLYGKDAFPVIYWPVDDFGVPDHKQLFIKLVDRIIKMLHNGNNLMVHSHAGIGRTGLLMCCIARRARNTLKAQKGNTAEMDSVEDIINLVRSQLRGAMSAEKQLKFFREVEL